MSLTIDTNGLKFVIFASGHDYTLADSGDGDVQIFSHPFVPLNSVNYAGQYYFIVPDENGDALDAVKDDVAHCTFTPALGTVFNTEGETTVEVNYHREYIHDEETIVVDKTVSQKIMVVNHGAVADQTTNLDVYADGYGFIRPLTVNGVEEKDYHITQKDAVTKLSSIPWRATGLGVSDSDGFFASDNLTDVSELAYADVSKCTKLIKVFADDYALTDISAVENWNVSNVEFIRYIVSDSGIVSLEAFAKWDTRSLTELEHAFHNYQGTSLHGLEGWNVSNVTNMGHVFDANINLTDATGISGWDVSSVQNLEYAFYNSHLAGTEAFALWNVPSLKNIKSIFAMSSHIVSLAGLSNWVAELTEIKEAFGGCTPINDISGVHGLDVHLVTDFSGVFAGCTKVLDLDGLEGWDVSSGETFYQMFANNPWIEDISAIANWDMSSAINTDEMFKNCASVIDLDDLADWRMGSPSMGGMFKGNSSCYSGKIGKKLYETAYYFYDYADNQYVNSEVQDPDTPLTYPTYDAAKASLWGVSGSNKDAFDAKWTNRPAWN